MIHSAKKTLDSFIKSIFDQPEVTPESKDKPVWSDALDAQKELLDNNNITELNCVLEYIKEYDLFLMDGGYIGFVIACQPTNGVNDEIRTAYQSLLSEEYPDDTLMQLSLAALPRIDNFLNGYKVLRGNRMAGADGELADALSEQVISYYSDARKYSLDAKSGIRPRDFEHWISVKIPIKEFVPTEKEIKEFLEIKERVFGMFEGIGLAPIFLDDEGWLSRMQTFYNHSDEALWRKKVKVNKSCTLGSQVLETGGVVKREANGLSFESGEPNSKGFATVMSLKQTPEFLNYGDLINLLGDWRFGKRTVAWNPYLMTLNVKIPNQYKAQDGFKSRESWLKKQAKGKILEYVESLKDQVTDYRSVSDELKNAGLCDISLSMIVLGENQADTVKATQKLRSAFSRKEYSFTIENVLAPSMFLNALPLGLDKEYIALSNRFDQWTTQGAAFLIPHSASWKGNTNKPILEFVTRFGQVFSLDLFKTDSSYNALICARSGAGKSFVTNKIVNAYMGSGVEDMGGSGEDGAQVFIIDKGRSYLNLANQYKDAQFIEFSNNMQFSLDPFASIDDFYGKEGQAAMVHSLLKCMASESGDLSDYQSTEMLTILTKLWAEHGKNSSVTLFADMCEEHADVDIIRIGRQLRPWCDEGVFGDFFGKKFQPVDFKSRLIVCEMDELSSQPHLSQCVLMSLINAAQHAMFLNGDKTRKLFILDEAWSYLRDRPGKVNYLAEFLESGWRRFRKTRAAGICITQSLLDAYQSQAGIAIVNNSPWKLMLAQEPETIDKLKELKAYDGTDQDYELMKSVHTDKGHYSEIFVRYEESREIVKLFVDKRTQLIYSTDADDRTLITSFKDKGYSISEAIEMAYQHRLAGG